MTTDDDDQVIMDIAISQRAPRHKKELFQFLRQQFIWVEGILLTPFETRAEAITGKHRKGDPERGAGFLIKHRGVREEYDRDRVRLYQLGRDLLPEVREQIEQGVLTKSFLHNWGLIMFCAGYCCAHILDNTDHLGGLRGGEITGKKRLKSAERLWVAKLILSNIARVKTRTEAEEITVKQICGILDEFKKSASEAKSKYGQFDAAWFKNLLVVEKDALKQTYTAKKGFSLAEMEKLSKQPSALAIPPLPTSPS
jgi:hypothetical protein